MSSQPPLDLSLRPWPSNSAPDTTNDVASLIARIQTQRGHFKDITEASLEAELSTASDPTSNDPPSQSHPGPSSPPPSPPTSLPNNAVAATNAAGNPNEPSDAAKAKTEMLELLHAAHNEALFTLDYLSLLVSQQSPEMGAPTMSPALKSSIPIGSLGWDRVTRKIDPKAYAADEVVTKAWKRAGLNSAADALLAASKTLMTRIDKEQKYWEQVKAIRDEGWAVVRHPREKNVLGVRYGFAEAGEGFREKGIGALRMKDDGSVVMDDVGVTGIHGNALLRVRVLKGGETVGLSVQKERRNGVPGSVRDQIERARNFIYDDELFFEICREARLLANLGVRTEEGSVSISLSDGRCIVLDMQSLDTDTSEPHDLPPTLTPEDSQTAQTILSTLRILLSYSHRLSYIKRSHPPAPLTPVKPKPQPLALLRPIATHLYHQTALSSLHRLLTRLTKGAIAAGFSDGNCKFNISPYTHLADKARVAEEKGEGKGVEATIHLFLGEIESNATVTFPGGVQCNIKLQTRLSPPWLGSKIAVTSISTTSGSGSGSAESTAAAAPGVTSNTGSGQQPQLQKQQHQQAEFWDTESLNDYLQLCLERGIVREILGWRTGWEQEAEDGEVVKTIGGLARKVRIMVGREGVGVTEGVVGGRDERWVWGEDGGRDPAGRDLRAILERQR